MQTNALETVAKITHMGTYVAGVGSADGETSLFILDSLLMVRGVLKGGG